MSYLPKNFNLTDVNTHLRNKNIGFVNDKKSSLLDKIFSILERFLKNYSAEKGKLVISEQIIENPLVFRSLLERDKNILDFGAFESILPLQLSALGYKVTVLDQRKYPFTHPNLTVLGNDIFSDSLKINKKFDLIISISTIEHMGFGRYGDGIVEDADKRAASILWNLVENNGRLIVSVPAGKPTIQRGYRVYNKKRIYEVFPNVDNIQWFTKKGREECWEETNENVIENLVYSTPYGQLPIEGVAFVTCKKQATC